MERAAIPPDRLDKRAPLPKPCDQKPVLFPMMKAFPAMACTALLLGLPAVHAGPPQPTCSSQLVIGLQRHSQIREIRVDRVDACRKLFASFPAEVAALYQKAHVRNMTRYLKEIGGKPYLITHYEYSGHDHAVDMARIEASDAMKRWRTAFAGLLASPGSHECEDVEEVFFTEGAADVTPSPAKYKRIGMVTGLKPDKEAEYRTLHATAWPGVLKGIRDSHYRNFSIGLVELDGSLILIGYLEYVGRDPAADEAAAKTLPVNKRWWKFTDACQQPLPSAAKGEIWDGMEEIHHLD